MSLDRRFIISFDWMWFLALLALTGGGLVTIWSTTEGTGIDSYFGKQFLYLGLALLAFLVLLYIDYHAISDYITLLYIGGLIFLVLVLFWGYSIHGARSWLPLGPVAFQPSEIMKILVIVALAKYYSETEREHLEANELLVGAFIVIVPVVLIVIQGDLGTAVTLVPIFVALSFLGGLKRKYAIVLLLILLLASPVGWLMLEDYQKGRIQTIFNLSDDPHHFGYQTIQSKIAIGSGRFLGKGFKQGSQSQLGFLPARHTDFIFAALSEEKGFLGSTIILGIFLFVFLRLLRTASEAKDRIGSMIVVGVLSLLLFHVTINIGMVVGLLPILGIPLPFISAGGSSLISSVVAMGLCMNVRMRRYVN